MVSGSPKATSGLRTPQPTASSGGGLVDYAKRVWWLWPVLARYQSVPTDTSTAARQSAECKSHRSAPAAGAVDLEAHREAGAAWTGDPATLSKESRRNTLVTVAWAWAWVSLFGLVVGVMDSCYVTGAVCMTVSFVGIFVGLAFWPRGYLWAHGEWPRIVLAAALTTILVSLVTIAVGWENRFHVHYTPSCNLVRH